MSSSEVRDWSPPARRSRLSRLRDGAVDDCWDWLVRVYGDFVSGWLRTWRHPQPSAGVGEFWSYFFLRGAMRNAKRGHRFRPYLAGCIHNFVREQRRGRTFPVCDSRSLESVAELQRQAADDGRWEWGQTILHRALDAVERAKPKRGAALRLFYGIGQRPGERIRTHRVSEVARRLDCAVASVSPMLTHARKLLRHAIESELRAAGGPEAELGEGVRGLGEALEQAHPGISVLEGAG